MVLLKHKFLKRSTVKTGLNAFFFEPKDVLKLGIFLLIDIMLEIKDYY